MKLAGRDAGKYAVIVAHKDGKVLIDGQTRRRYVNPAHLYLTDMSVSLGENADHQAVVDALAQKGITVVEHIKQKDIVQQKKK